MDQLELGLLLSQLLTLAIGLVLLQNGETTTSSSTGVDVQLVCIAQLVCISQLACIALFSASFASSKTLLLFCCVNVFSLLLSRRRITS